MTVSMRRSGRTAARSSLKGATPDNGEVREDCRNDGSHGQAGYEAADEAHVLHERNNTTERFGVLCLGCHTL